MICPNPSRFSLLTRAYPYPGRSTRYQKSLMMKWFMVWVLPGLLEVFARFFRFVSIFNSDDLPTFDRPMKANSGLLSGGHFFTSATLDTNSACLISIRHP